MNTRENPEQKLSELLQVEIQHASALLNFLHNESSVLASDDPTPEPADSTSKISLINNLQSATRARMEYMAAQGLFLENGRLVDTARTMTEDNQLQPLFSQLAQLAQQCFEENRLIGQLINRRSQFVTRILDSLSPQASNPHAETYGENGNTTTGPRHGLLNLAQ